MRLPLHRQILIPMVGILLLTVSVVSALNAWLATAQVRAQIERRLDDVAQTLSASNFPLEATVLAQTRGLSGAEYVVLDQAGQPLAASRNSLVPDAIARGARPGPLDVWRPVRSGPASYLHAAVPLDRRPIGGGQFLLHAFYPESTWRQTRWQAIWPPLAIGAAAVALVTAAAVAVARHVTQPIATLRNQVERLAEGDFRPVQEPPRNDEIRDLATTVNQLAQRLARYETETRQSERLKTLGLLGGGIAHQIRNAATGCRIALDLHERDCPLAQANAHPDSSGSDEPLAVAARQLELIESHIQRFLTLGRPAAAVREVVDLNGVLQEVLGLVGPTACHVEVRLEPRLAPGNLIVRGDRESLVQMLVNLLVNAIEAVAKARVAAGAGATSGGQHVVCVQTLDNAGQCEVAIIDPGPGPSPAIQARLFEPFATDKAGGTGLGLVVARQIAEDHGGSIRWERREDRTWFIVTLPRVDAGAD